MSKEQIEEYVRILTENPNLVDNIPEEAIDTLINYLQEEIKVKEKIINELKGSTDNL